MAKNAKAEPVVLCILDGWGHRLEADHNAIAQTPTPVYDRLTSSAAMALLASSGEDVGLPAGQMGNSEVGHQIIGAGRVVLQDLPRIDAAIADGSLGQNPQLLAFIERLRQSGGACHLMGLLSPGGVHAHSEHILALARLLAAAGIEVRVHAFLDGRDTPPRSAAGYFAEFEQSISTHQRISIATVCGRYYAMDRDKRWARVSCAYDNLIGASGHSSTSAAAAIERAYRSDVGDEFVEPAAIAGYAGMDDGDGLLMANFRADRAREILTALLDPAFEEFARARTISFAAALGMASYSSALDALMPALFPAQHIESTLGEIVAAAGLRQFRIAETEKYAHVTFFLNGGEEGTFAGEERILIPSPQVATYDLQPEMSADEVTDRLVEAIGSQHYHFVVVNYANADMVGHTGIVEAAQIAVATIDRCLGRLVSAVQASGAALLITADHGNIEQMRDASGYTAHTAHTTNPVPLLLVNAGTGIALADGRLSDIAPTVLELMGLPVPSVMTGRSRLRPAEGGKARARERRARTG